MASNKPQFAVVGLGVMGQNLALNIVDHGFPIAVWNRELPAMDQWVAQHASLPITQANTLEQLVAAMDRPRSIMLMVTAGSPVDEVVNTLRPLLAEGDVIIDGGNSWFKDTQRREADLKSHGIHFVGAGVSGGEVGARHGPSIMPGGDASAYEKIRPVFEAISAKTESGSCVTHVGPDGAGHFVKMVHNGIEYADMQLIAEAYDILRSACGLQAPQLAEVFAGWNRGSLESFLIELTSQVLRRVDEETGQPLVDLVLDQAGQKGTGKWTAQVALDLGVPVPTITAATEARELSALKQDRIAVSKALQGPTRNEMDAEPERWIAAVADALFAARLCAYAQGMNLIRAASATYHWNVNRKEVARIWKGGCIIRARILDSIMDAFGRDLDLAYLLLDPELSTRVCGVQHAWRHVVHLAQSSGIPCPAFSASLAYFDGYRSAMLPQNLIQAQRDAFGAHTYQRIDHPERGFVHTDWRTKRV